MAHLCAPECQTDNLSTEQILIEHPLYARYCLRAWVSCTCEELFSWTEANEADRVFEGKLESIRLQTITSTQKRQNVILRNLGTHNTDGPKKVSLEM